MGACKEANGRLIESALILFPQTLGNLHREHWFGLYPVLVAVAIVADFDVFIDAEIIAPPNAPTITAPAR